MRSQPASYHGYRFPPDIISHAVWGVGARIPRPRCATIDLLAIVATASACLAVKKRGRRRWKKTSGYHGQARVENAFFRYKSIIGDSLRACSPAGRGTEVDLACNILNQMTGLGRPMSYRIGR